MHDELASILKSLRAIPLGTKPAALISDRRNILRSQTLLVGYCAKTGTAYFGAANADPDVVRWTELKINFISTLQILARFGSNGWKFNTSARLDWIDHILSQLPQSSQVYELNAEPKS